MPCRKIAVFLGLVLLLAAENVLGQPTITSLQPRSCQPGATTRLTVTGQDLNDGLRLVTSCDSAEVHVEAVEAEKATIELTLPEDVPLGPLGLWMATHDGPAEPLVIIVDDLPTIAENGDHHSPESAQKITTLTAVDGVSDGAESDYYRIEVAEGERVAFEILTQPLASKMDPVIRLLDETGETLYLADDDEVGSDVRFRYQFAQAGEYLIEVHDNRYVAGGRYHLRVGDFPILRHAYPLTIAPGQRTTVQFAGIDGDEAENGEVEFPAQMLESTPTVATRFPEGRSSAWVPIRVCNLPQFVEDESSEEDAARSGEPLTFPVAISGRLSRPQQRDEYTVQGIKDASVRIRSRTRSLGCASLLRMRLFNPAGDLVAQTAVSESDEWSFEYTFPDDEAYRLEVADLLGRGGDDFGYCVELVPAGTFAIQVKADAKIRQQFALEPGHGACAIDLQVQRFEYDGEIELSLTGEESGVRILNPRIAAGAEEARLYLVADKEWNPDSLAATGLRARASDDPTLQCKVTSLAWQRAKKPHVPYPSGWSDGVIVLSGVPGSDAAFALEPAGTVRFARPLNRHQATLNLQRIRDAFKADVTLLPDALPAGWQMEVQADQDAYAATFTRGADAVAEPERLRLLAFAEHQNRSRIETVDLPLEWFDPLTVGLESTGPLVAGRAATLVAEVDRQGDDPQPVNLELRNCSEITSSFADGENIVVFAQQLVSYSRFGSAKPVTCFGSFLVNLAGQFGHHR